LEKKFLELGCKVSKSGAGCVSSEIQGRGWATLVCLHSLTCWCSKMPLVSILHGWLWSAAPLGPRRGKSLLRFMALGTA